MKDKLKVPKLRFKEFSGEWEEKILEKAILLKSDKYNPEKNKEKFNCIELEHLSQ